MYELTYCIAVITHHNHTNIFLVLRQGFIPVFRAPVNGALFNPAGKEPLVGPGYQCRGSSRAFRAKNSPQPIEQGGGPAGGSGHDQLNALLAATYNGATLADFSDGDADADAGGDETAGSGDAQSLKRVGTASGYKLD